MKILADFQIYISVYLQFYLVSKFRGWTLFGNIPQAYSHPCQTRKMEVFAKIVNGFQLLTLCIKISISGVSQGSKFVSTYRLIEALRILHRKSL